MVRHVMVSGCFDPLHDGHVSFFKEARRFGDKLIVVIDPDDYTETKHIVFMSLGARQYVISNLSCVDVAIACRPSITVCDMLRLLVPTYYVVGPDHDLQDDVPEFKVCQQLGITPCTVHPLRHNSSSNLLRSYVDVLQQSSGDGQRDRSERPPSLGSRPRKRRRKRKA